MSEFVVLKAPDYLHCSAVVYVVVKKPMANMDLMDITDAECDRYIKKLIPRLLRKKPAEWTRVADIANDPQRFVEVVECLASYRFFDDNEGYCLIELNNDASCIRVYPDAIRFPYRKNHQWKFARY